MKKIGIAIIGAGLIGAKRAAVIRKTRIGKLLAVTDTNIIRGAKLAEAHGCRFYSNYRDAIRAPGVNVIVIAVPNFFVFRIASFALKEGKHILCEKPFGINSRESLLMIQEARKKTCIIKVGFNHRFHPAIAKARKIFDAGAIGRLLFIRARYGHGGRFGLEKEWRSNKRISGGGELLDQGIHIIDLCRWFGGGIKEVYGNVETKFWPIKVDDNAFVLMKSATGVVSQFHVSTTNWKNIFSFELFGDKGFLEIEGKGGSYGEESLIYGLRMPRFGVPKIKTFKFQGDVSWVDEWKNFLSAIKHGKKIIGDAEDGLKANRIVNAVYQSSKTKIPVRLKA